MVGSSKRDYWPDEHKAVINEFLRIAKTGTEVIFITGNHDEFLRDYAGFATWRIYPDRRIFV